MKLNIKSKLIVGFALLLVLSSLVQAATFSIAGDFIYSSLKNFQLVEANNGAKDIRNFFVNLNSISFAIAENYKLNSVSSSQSANKNIDGIIGSTLLQNPQIEAITLLKPNGQEILKIDQNSKRITSSGEAFWTTTEDTQEANSGKTQISKIYYTKSESGPHIDILTPVIINNLTPVFIKMQVNLEILRRQLSEIQIGNSGYIYLVDDKGIQ